ncbi:hypothetical protein [Mesorhizobium sp. SP-1A]|uniref:hypothetical protein n=1 Tax=Mesorhizobium sp. SP-1A TaxID=3077840 RepID=UPI0028F70B6B|nr:hypothetical protein [Mesorhizobium sp. SP-1A]
MTDHSQFQSILPAHAGAADISAVRPGNLAALLGRIEEAVDEETDAIRIDTSYDLKASNARKSRYLYELNRAMKSISNEYLVQHRDGLLRLRQKLARNEAAILAHLNAVNEVATLLKNAIQNAEADGTYSAGEFGWARS